MPRIVSFRDDSKDIPVVQHTAFSSLKDKKPKAVDPIDEPEAQEEELAPTPKVQQAVGIVMEEVEKKDVKQDKSRNEMNGETIVAEAKEEIECRKEDAVEVEIEENPERIMPEIV